MIEFRISRRWYVQKWIPKKPVQTQSEIVQGETSKAFDLVENTKEVTAEAAIVTSSNVAI